MTSSIRCTWLNGMTSPCIVQANYQARVPESQSIFNRLSPAGSPETYPVLPCEFTDRIAWRDSAGYWLAESEKPSPWHANVVTTNDCHLNIVIINSYKIIGPTLDFLRLPACIRPPPPANNLSVPGPSARLNLLIFLSIHPALGGVRSDNNATGTTWYYSRSGSTTMKGEQMRRLAMPCK